MVQYKRNLTIGRHAVEWGSQLLPALRSRAMNVCENKISKTGNQNKNCADVKSVTAYCSMGAKVVFRRQVFSFTNTRSENKKRKSVTDK